MSIKAMKTIQKCLKDKMYAHAEMYLAEAIEQAEKHQALDKKAENARELGLDYEPVQQPLTILQRYPRIGLGVEGTLPIDTPPTAQPAAPLTDEFASAYWEACNSSQPKDWMNAALAAQRVLKTAKPATPQPQQAEKQEPVEDMAVPSGGREGGTEEDRIEEAFWRFDARHKGYGQWKTAPMSEREAFKAEMRNALALKKTEKQEPDLTEQGRTRSAIIGNNVEAMMDAGLPFLKALETTLKVYDHTTRQPQQAEKQEPHSWYSAEHDEWMSNKTRKEHEALNSYTHKVGGFDLPLYTALQQREWVGLTPYQFDQLEQLFGHTVPNDFVLADIVCTVESKLKENNQ